jgi:enoyl-CoA hydratase/carnithine racemase
LQDDFAVVCLNNVARHNALSIALMRELITCLEDIGGGEARGVILAGNGPSFCSGHDFNDMAGEDFAFMRKLFRLCTRLMDTIQNIPQPVLARVHGAAIGAGCQMAASCDLVVAADDATFITPGGKSGWFCHTPMVALSRNLGRKRALEMLLTGRPIAAKQAAEWGLINYAVAPSELESFSFDLLREATQGSQLSFGIGKQAFYTQLDLDQHKAYAYGAEMMAATSQVPEAQRRMQKFLERRKKS